MKELKLVVLDVDGVLRDSSKVFYECHKKALEHVGFGREFKKYFTVKDIWHFKGLGKFNNKRDSLNAIFILMKTGKIDGIHEIIYKPNAEQLISKLVNSAEIKVNDDVLDGMVAEYKKVALSIDAGKMVKMYPGIENIVKKLKKNKKIAIFTNSDLSIIKRDLKDLLLEFDYVITPKDIIISKPSGEGLLLISKKSGIDPKNMVYVADTVVDVRAAKDAGCISAVVLNGMGLKQHLEKENPDFFFRDVDEAVDWILNS